MVISFLIISFISFSGLSLTYLFAKNETFLWRISAGNIIGSAVFGLICFLLANFFGLSIITVIISLVISLSPLFLLRNSDTKARLKGEWQRAKDKTQGASFKKFWQLLYYLFFLVLFLAFFDRAVIIGNEGIFTGAGHNVGDLPFHLGGIFSFTDGNNFPPQNPSYADTKFTYPFIADFLTSCLVKLGASVQSAMFVQNVTWAFSLLIILERFVFKLTNNKIAGKIAPFLLFFSGGFGFFGFFRDYWQGTQGIFEILWNLPQDYTIGKGFRWGNSLITLFITQRSLLLGMPLTIMVLGYLWQDLVRGGERENERRGEEEKKGRKKKQGVLMQIPMFSHCLLFGLLAGTLPLIHVHSLLVLFIASAFWFFFSLRNWKFWIVFGVGVSVIAVPQLFWVLTGSAIQTGKFITWHFGWDSRGENIVWFWLTNTGIFIPLLLFSIFGILLTHFFLRKEATEKTENGLENVLFPTLSPSFSLSIALFLPFLFIFIASNVMKFAPWEWDNIKLLIYWFVGSIPFVALILAWFWQKDKVFKGIAIFCLFLLMFAGGLDVWRTASWQLKYEVFDKGSVEIAEIIKQETEPNALFLNAPTYNSAVVLSGRRSLMRYIGHLSSYGIDYQEREKDLQRIYLGEATAEILLKKYSIDYVLISPREEEYLKRNSLQLNRQFWQKYKLIGQAGDFKVYKVR